MRTELPRLLSSASASRQVVALAAPHPGVVRDSLCVHVNAAGTEAATLLSVGERDHIILVRGGAYSIENCAEVKFLGLGLSGPLAWMSPGAGSPCRRSYLMRYGANRRHELDRLIVHRKTRLGQDVVLGFVEAKTPNGLVYRLMVGDHLVSFVADIGTADFSLIGEIVHLNYRRSGSWYEWVVTAEGSNDPRQITSGLLPSSDVWEQVTSFRWHGREAFVRATDDAGTTLSVRFADGWEEVQGDMIVDFVVPDPTGETAVIVASPSNSSVASDVPYGKVLWEETVLARGYFLVTEDDISWSPDGSVPAVAMARLLDADSDEAEPMVVTPRDELRRDEGVLREPIVDNDGRLVASVWDSKGSDGSKISRLLLGPEGKEETVAQHIWNTQLRDGVLQWNSCVDGHVLLTRLRK
jgi:hypothetical protein